MSPELAHRVLRGNAALQSLSRQRWGNRPASLWIAEDFWVLRFRLMVKRGPWSRPQASKRRSAAWTILLDWTFQSMRRVSACQVEIVQPRVSGVNAWRARTWVRK